MCILQSYEQPDFVVFVVYCSTDCRYRPKLDVDYGSLYSVFNKENIRGTKTVVLFDSTYFVWSGLLGFVGKS